MAELVTVVNRSSKLLHGTWDGRHYDIEPGKKYQFPEIQAQKFKDQNPVMGSENHLTGELISLIAIEEHGDDASPVEQTDSITRNDLLEKIKSGELKVVKGNGMYTFADKVPGLSNDSSFVKP